MLLPDEICFSDHVSVLRCVHVQGWEGWEGLGNSCICKVSREESLLRLELTMIFDAATHNPRFSLLLVHCSWMLQQDNAAWNTTRKRAGIQLWDFLSC